MLLFRLGGQLLTFVVLILLSRHLGPKVFGQYATLMSFIGFCAILLAPSLNDLLVRDAMKSTRGRDWVLRNGYGLRLLLALTAGIAAVIISPLIGWEGITVAVTGLGAAGLFFSLWTPSWRFAYETPLQLDFRLDVAAGVNLLGRILLLGTLLYAVLLGSGLIGIVAAGSIGELLASLLLWILLVRRKYAVSPLFDQAELRRQLHEAAPIILAETLTMIYTRLDILMLNRMAGATEAGLFAGPMRIVDGLAIIPTVVLASATPILNRLRLNDPARYKAAAALTYRMMWVSGLAVALPVSLFSGEITRLFYGPAYAGSAAVMRFGAWVAPLAFTAAIWQVLMIIGGKQRVIVYVYGGLCVLNVGLNLLLIPYFGATGAAVAKVVTFAALFPLTLFWTDARRYGWKLGLGGWIPFALTLGTAYLLSGAKLAMWWGMPMVVAGAAAFIWFSGWFGPKRLLDAKRTFFGRNELGRG